MNAMQVWKSLPVSLKILFVVLLVWVAMSTTAVTMMPEREIAFFGLLLSNIPAITIVLLLDVISPLVFLYAMWEKLKWGANFGMLYNGIFVLNNLIALFLFRDVFGNAMLFPLVAGTLFFYVIYRNRNYFS